MVDDGGGAGELGGLRAGNLAVAMDFVDWGHGDGGTDFRDRSLGSELGCFFACLCQGGFLLQFRDFWLDQSLVELAGGVLRVVPPLLLSSLRANEEIENNAADDDA